MGQRQLKNIVAAITIIIIIGLVVGIFFKVGDRSQPVKENIRAVVSVIVEPVSNIAGGISDGFQGILRFKSIIKENGQLKEEINRMKQKQMNQQLTREELKELKELSTVFRYEVIEHNALQAANITAMNSTDWMKTFTIDQGSDSGIKLGNAVVSGDGLVGKVTEVSNNTAKVVSLIEEKNKVSFQVERNTKLTGVIQGGGRQTLSGYLLDNKTSVKKGDVLLTSGIGTYPKGLKLGTITEVQKDTGTQFVRFMATPSVPYNQLKKVAVIL